MPQESSHTNYAQFSIGVLIVIVLGAGAYFYSASSGGLGGGFSHSLAAGESIKNWNFENGYTGKPELEERARNEIVRLEDLLGVESDEHTDYTLYVSIANQYNLLGDGENEYAYLKRALAIDPENTGLAWFNLGNLLSRLGAPKSALDAYGRAARAQNQQFQYQTAYLEYYTETFGEDRAGIEAAYTTAAGIFGDNATFLEIMARWYAETGRNEEAIDAWKKVKVLSPAAAQAIDAEIARLENQL